MLVIEEKSPLFPMLGAVDDDRAVTAVELKSYDNSDEFVVDGLSEYGGGGVATRVSEESLSSVCIAVFAMVDKLCLRCELMIIIHM